MSSSTRAETCRVRHFEFPNYWEEKVEDAFSFEELMGQIHRIARAFAPEKNERMCVYVEKGGDELQLGLGDADWLMIFHGQDGRCLASLGDTTAEGYQPFVFPEWTEVAKKHLVSVSTAKQVLRHWFDTGKLSDAVRWTQ
jgi:hypothetical protein